MKPHRFPCCKVQTMVTTVRSMELRWAVDEHLSRLPSLSLSTAHQQGGSLPLSRAGLPYGLDGLYPRAPRFRGPRTCWMHYWKKRGRKKIKEEKERKKEGEKERRYRERKKERKKS